MRRRAQRRLSAVSKSEDEKSDSVLEGAVSIDLIRKGAIKPLAYYMNFIADAADDFVARASNNERDKLHVLRIVEARVSLIENYKQILRRVSNEAATAQALQEVTLSAFLIGLVSDRDGLQQEEAKILFNAQRSQIANAKKSADADERRDRIGHAVQEGAESYLASGHVKKIGGTKKCAGNLLKHLTSQKILKAHGLEDADVSVWDVRGAILRLKKKGRLPVSAK